MSRRNSCIYAVSSLDGVIIPHSGLYVNAFFIGYEKSFNGFGAGKGNQTLFDRVEAGGTISIPYLRICWVVIGVQSSDPLLSALLFPTFNPTIWDEVIFLNLFGFSAFGVRYPHRTKLGIIFTALPFRIRLPNLAFSFR